MSVASWRAALRIARRDALRSKGRSALIVAMIALPVLGMSAADVTYRTRQLDPGEKAVRVLGRADAVLTDTGVNVPGEARDGGGRVPISQKPDGSGWGTEARDQEEGREEGDREEGRREASIPSPPDLTAVVPGTLSTVPDERWPGAMVTTANGRKEVMIREFDYAAPLAEGMVLQRTGRAPRTSGEVAVTEALRRSGGYRIGDTLSETLTGRTFRIVGTVDVPDSLRDVTVFARPGAVIGEALIRATGTAATPLVERSVLVDTAGPVTWEAVKEANRSGVLVVSRAVLLDPPPRAEVDQGGDAGGGVSRRSLALGGVAVGLGLLEMVLLAGPAFAVGARRRRRETALIAVAGGSRRQVGGVILAGGVVLGAAGAVLGTALGLATAAALGPWFAERSGSLAGHFDVRPLELLAIAGVGAGVGVLAALVPAFVAAREDIVVSLTSRRGVRRGSRVLPVAGAGITALGVAVALKGSMRPPNADLILAGVVLAELGLVACCPAIVGITARFGRFLPLGPRLALRDAARNRPRSAPAVAAVMAAVSGSVAIAVVWGSKQEDTVRNYQPTMRHEQVMVMLPEMSPGGVAGVTAGTPSETVGRIAATITNVLPGAKPTVIHRYLLECADGERVCASPTPVLPSALGCPPKTVPADGTAFTERDADCVAGGAGPSRFRNAVGDATVFRTLTGTDDSAVAAVLDRGGVVVRNPRYVADGEVTVRIADPATGADRDVRLPGIAVDVPFQPSPMFLSPGAVRTLGLGTAPGAVTYEPESALPDKAEQRLLADLSQFPGAWVAVERGPQPRDDGRMLMLTVFALVTTIGAAGVATGLALADAQRDLATLGAVGAPPGVRRILSACQGAVIAALGTVLGLAAGVLAGVAIRRGQRSSYGGNEARAAELYSIVIPWGRMGLGLIVLPLLAALLAGVLTRSRVVARSRAT